MNEHLPECWAKHESDPPAWCICEELRACEDRVARAFHVVRTDDTKQWEKTARNQFDAGYADAGEAGYLRGLDAAREAVKGVNWFNDEGKMLSAVVATADSIAAIDALRGES